MRRRKVVALIATGTIALAAQLIRPSRDNPPVSGDLAVPTEIKMTLLRACYDCHSNQTKWPWYSAIAPMGWLVSAHVHDARNHLNFSQWDDYVSDPGTAAQKLRAIAQTIGSGAMPPRYYRLAHPQSRLNASARNELIKWAKQEEKRAASEQ